jgi:hypothetical protein
MKKTDMNYSNVNNTALLPPRAMKLRASSVAIRKELARDQECGSRGAAQHQALSSNHRTQKKEGRKDERRGGGEQRREGGKEEGIGYQIIVISY